MTAVASSPSARTARLGLRATPEQEVVLRRAAEVAHKSLTDFILDSACLAAEQTLLDQRLFMVPGAGANHERAGSAPGPGEDSGPVGGGFGPSAQGLGTGIAQGRTAAHGASG